MKTLSGQDKMTTEGGVKKLKVDGRRSTIVLNSFCQKK